jgi:DNA replication ATP-dependent helicase Dna2
MELLKEFVAAIEIDRLNALADYEESMGQPLDERIAKGNTMANLRVAFTFYGGLPNGYCAPLSGALKYIDTVNVYCDNNISKFKEGSTVILSNGTYRFEMDIEEDSTDRFILKSNDFNVKFAFIDAHNYPRNNWEINAAHITISSELLMTAAIILKAQTTVLEKIENFLNGHAKNTYKDNSTSVGYLNDSQNQAYLNAINASDFCIIQGPPGTGKTETIAHITKHLIDSGLKVFITAPTHTAINNCLNAVSSKVHNSGRVIKIGEKPQNKEIQSNSDVSRKSRFTYYNSNYDGRGIAIGATAYSLCYPRSKRLDGWEFDVAIVDEASQLSIPLAVAAMLRTTKYIFVGDHKQLDPIIPKGFDNEMFAESVFSRLARKYPKQINLLNNSYRLNAALINIPNALFYNDLLHADYTTKFDDMNYACTGYSDLLNNDPHVLALHNVFDSQGRSPFEAKIVAQLVYQLQSNGVKFKDIGIISPYRAQVREIKKEIENHTSISNRNGIQDLFIDTVDSIQGQERAYIIYSMSNSHPLESMRRLDFFYSPNRLNVAITRAVKKCIVIANYKVFDIIDQDLVDHPSYPDIKYSLEIFKNYHKLSTKVDICPTENKDDEW